VAVGAHALEVRVLLQRERGLRDHRRVLLRDRVHRGLPLVDDVAVAVGALRRVGNASVSLAETLSLSRRTSATWIAIAAPEDHGERQVDHLPALQHPLVALLLGLAPAVPLGRPGA
jgi:hypothetical protein